MGDSAGPDVTLLSRFTSIHHPSAWQSRKSWHRSWSARGCKAQLCRGPRNCTSRGSLHDLRSMILCCAVPVKAVSESSTFAQSATSTAIVTEQPSGQEPDTHSGLIESCLSSRPSSHPFGHSIQFHGLSTWLTRYLSITTLPQRDQAVQP